MLISHFEKPSFHEGEKRTDNEGAEYNEARSKYRQELRQRLSYILDASKNTEEAVSTIKETIKPFLEACKKLEEQDDVDCPVLKNISEVDIFRSLRECFAISGKQEFINKCEGILGPILDFMAVSPRLEEKVRREIFVEKGGFSKVNELLSISEESDTIWLHLAPAKTLSLSEKLALFKQGLQKLAKLLTEKDNVKNIRATSWIVVQHPKLFERLGFTVEGPISSDDRERYFNEESREVWGAYIDRNDFLTRYGQIKA